MPETTAQKNRRVRQETERERLSAAGHIQHVTDLLDKIVDPQVDIDVQMHDRYKTVINTKLKLINKFLPDLKSTELTGEGGGEVGHTHRVVEYVVPDSPPEI